MTIIEVLVLLSLLAVLLAMAVPQLRTRPVRVAGNSVVAFIQQGKFEAIRLNRPVHVVLASDGAALELHVNSSMNDYSCGATGIPVRSVDLTEYPRVRAESDGLPFLWLPSGIPRACGGAAMPGGGIPIFLSDGRDQLEVSVSSGGAVTSQ